MRTFTQAEINDLLEEAWGIIANGNGGNWDEATPEWKDAAIRWRGKYFEFLRETK